ncbi:MAG: Xaa-Pro peptidase family protein [Candidatus Omnitrophica bacterium]|nr:Xaa-Pro peptidase family protein [Candidatus Omnitrophota bacterium]
MNIYHTRIKNLRKSFQKAGVDTLLVSKPENIFYLSGFRGCDSYLVVTLHDTYILTDSRYENELRQSTIACKILVLSKDMSLADLMNGLMKKKRLKSVGFEPAHIAYYQYRHFNKFLKTKKLKPCFRIVENLRIIKDASEIKAIKRAITIAERSLYCVSRVYFSKRYREKDLGDYLEYTMKKKGADGVSFPAIVATGTRSAFPHAVSGRAHIKRNSILLIDFGAKKDGYCSDLTRTFFLGTITPRFKLIYSLVCEAQHLAIDSIKVGERISSVDKKVRLFFKKNKVDQYFNHALGHGIGLDVHESPSLIYSSNERFTENMVFTVEPGLYFNTWGGIRIEDMVRVTSSGCERLTHYPH